MIDPETEVIEPAQEIVPEMSPEVPAESVSEVAS